MCLHPGAQTAWFLHLSILKVYSLEADYILSERSYIYMRRRGDYGHDYLPTESKECSWFRYILWYHLPWNAYDNIKQACGISAEMRLTITSSVGENVKCIQYNMRLTIKLNFHWGRIILNHSSSPSSFTRRHPIARSSRSRSSHSDWAISHIARSDYRLRSDT